MQPKKVTWETGDMQDAIENSGTFSILQQDTDGGISALK